MAGNFIGNCKFRSMKKLLLVCLVGASCLSLAAQGNSGNKGNRGQSGRDNNPSVISADTTPVKPTKSKDQGNKAKTNKGKNNDARDANEKEKKDREAHDKKVWDGVSGAEGCGKPSKNQPAKVRAAFTRDYPMAVNVRWTKCRGDWTATFANGPFMSTAVYHANGDRRDTRTPVVREQLPRVVLDSVFKRRPGINIGDVIRIELPGGLPEIFRIRTDEATPQFMFFSKLGELVRYDY